MPGIRDAFTYSELLECLRMLPHHTGARTVGYLLAVLGSTITEGRLRHMLRYLVRKRRLIRHGKGCDARFSVASPCEPDRIVKRKIELSARKWPGEWSILTYDVPMPHATARKRLVGILHHMGFAMLSASSWISPYDWSEALHEVFGNWGFGGVASYIRSADVVWLTGRTGRCSADLWNLEGINRAYMVLARKCARALRGRQVQAMRGRARVTLWAIRQLAAVEKRDPMLPAELLPRKWMRQKALQYVRRLQTQVVEEADAPSSP